MWTRLLCLLLVKKVHCLSRIRELHYFPLPCKAHLWRIREGKTYIQIVQPASYISKLSLLLRRLFSHVGGEMTTCSFPRLYPPCFYMPPLRWPTPNPAREKEPNDDWPGWPAFFRHWYRGSVHLCSCVPSISIVSIVFSANILLCTPVLMHQHIVCRQPIKHFLNGLSFIVFITFGLYTHTMGFYIDWIHNISMSWQLLHSWCIDSRTACKHAHRLKKRWH